MVLTFRVDYDANLSTYIHSLYSILMTKIFYELSGGNPQNW